MRPCPFSGATAWIKKERPSCDWEEQERNARIANHGMDGVPETLGREHRGGHDYRRHKDQEDPDH